MSAVVVGTISINLNSFGVKIVPDSFQFSKADSTVETDELDLAAVSKTEMKRRE